MPSLDSRLSTVEAVVKTLSDAKVTDRLMEMETKQKSHEEANALAISGIRDDLVKVEAVAMEAHSMVTETNNLVGQMPEKIIKAIDEREEQREKKRREDSKGKRIEIRDWIIGAAVVAGPILAVLMAKAVH